MDGWEGELFIRWSRIRRPLGQDQGDPIDQQMKEIKQKRYCERDKTLKKKFRASITLRIKYVEKTCYCVLSVQMGL